MAKINWNENGWTILQEADASKHIQGVSCRTENGMVVEVRVRHHDSEEATVKVLLNGEPALPMEIKAFEKHFNKDDLDIE